MLQEKSIKHLVTSVKKCCFLLIERLDKIDPFAMLTALFFLKKICYFNNHWLKKCCKKKSVEHLVTTAKKWCFLLIECLAEIDPFTNWSVCSSIFWHLLLMGLITIIQLTKNWNTYNSSIWHINWREMGTKFFTKMMWRLFIDTPRISFN